MSEAESPSNSTYNPNISPVSPARAIVVPSDGKAIHRIPFPCRRRPAKESSCTLTLRAEARRLTAHVEFAGAVGGEGTPVGLVRGGPSVTHALWLPWLIESLEVEDVDAPLQHPTHGLLVERLRVGGACLCRSVVGTTCENVSRSRRPVNVQGDCAHRHWAIQSPRWPARCCCLQRFGCGQRLAVGHRSMSRWRF